MRNISVSNLIKILESCTLCEGTEDCQDERGKIVHHVASLNAVDENAI